MKKHLLIGLLIILFKVSFSQYLPLSNSNVSWVLIVDNGFGGKIYEYYEIDSLNSDTIINTKVYTKLYDPSYLGAFLSNLDGKTFFVPKDSTNEFLLYDFSKNKGDTVYNILKLTIGQEYKLVNEAVDSVEYITVGPKTLKKIYLDSDAENNWIESIGSTRGFFNRDAVWLSATTLYCMSYNDTTYYPNWALGACSLDNGDGIEEIDNVLINPVYPNPNNGLFSVKYEGESNEYLTIVITDMLGKIVFQKNDFVASHIIDLSEQTAGVYLVRVFSDKKLFSKKLIID